MALRGCITSWSSISWDLTWKTFSTCATASSASRPCAWPLNRWQVSFALTSFLVPRFLSLEVWQLWTNSRDIITAATQRAVFACHREFGGIGASVGKGIVHTGSKLRIRHSTTCSRAPNALTPQNFTTITSLPLSSQCLRIVLVHRSHVYKVCTRSHSFTAISNLTTSSLVYLVLRPRISSILLVSSLR